MWYQNLAFRCLFTIKLKNLEQIGQIFDKLELNKSMRHRPNIMLVGPDYYLQSSHAVFSTKNVSRHFYWIVSNSTYSQL